MLSVNWSSTKQMSYKLATCFHLNKSRYWRMNLRGPRKVITTSWQISLNRLIKSHQLEVVPQKWPKILSWPQLHQMSKLCQRFRIMLNSNNKVSKATLPITALKCLNRILNNKNLVTTFDKTKKWAILSFIINRLKDNRRKKVFSTNSPLKMRWKSKGILEVIVKRNSKLGEIISSIWPSRIIYQPWTIPKTVEFTQFSNRPHRGMPTFLKVNHRLRQITSRRVLVALTKNSVELVSSKPEECKIRLK